MKHTVKIQHSPMQYVSYIVGLVLSVVITLAAYHLVVNQILPKETLLYAIMGLAVAQLIVQLVFFLHVGKEKGWKLMTFLLAMIFVLIVVVGSIWIMKNLDYNMMKMSPEQMNEYMYKNQGL